MLLMLCTHVISGSVAGQLVLNSSVTQSGREFACDGERVTFTCKVVRSSILQWNIPSISDNSITYRAGLMPPAIASRQAFLATLKSTAGDGASTNFTSTLQVNVSREIPHNVITVECRNHREEDAMEASFTVASE